MGYLTTHVLDAAHSCPGEGIKVSLFRLQNDQSREQIQQVLTNADGRCDQPILDAEAFRKGTYELVFEVGEYFRKRGVELPEPAFLEEVVLRFGIADEAEHYHVPLLVSPYSYSTYRGS